jgi:branched-chain amino acid transport system substrate-binding protein
MAVAQINQRGGLLGRKIQLLLEDGESKAEAGAQKVSDLMAEAPQISAFVGLSDTDLTLAAAKVAAMNNRVFLTSGATSPLLPEQIPSYLYLACFGDNVQAAAAAEWSFQTLEARSALVLYDSIETYTVLLQKYFVDRFESLGGQIAVVKGYDPNNGLIGSEVLPVVDMVFLSSGSALDAKNIILRLRDKGVKVPVIGGDGYESETIWEAQPDIMDVYYTTHAYLGEGNTQPVVQSFAKAYASVYGGQLPDAFAALGYDAIHLMAAAITQAGSSDPDNVRKTFAQLKDIPGVTGTVSYSDNEAIPNKSVTIMAVNKGARAFQTEWNPEVIPHP